MPGLVLHLKQQNPRQSRRFHLGYFGLFSEFSILLLQIRDRIARLPLHRWPCMYRNIHLR